MDSCQWNYGVPGGFVTNTPQRQVNAYGNGCGIDESGGLIAKPWSTTFWTAKMSQSNIALETATEEMPAALRQLVPTLRELFQKVHPDAQITPFTFSIAVCNNYTEPDMYIAAHTDDNKWYPSECQAGPLFASLTLYPDGEPAELDDYARFQIRRDPKIGWEPIHLRHGSVLIMPSSIEHRVLKHTKSRQSRFRRRINITFRSTYPQSQNPLMNAMAVANHTRYYRIPKAVHHPEDICEVTLLTIWDAYNELAKAHGHPEVELCPYSEPNRDQLKSAYLEKTRSGGFPPVKMGNNMVNQLIEMVICSI